MVLTRIPLRPTRARCDLDVDVDPGGLVDERHGHRAGGRANSIRWCPGLCASALQGYVEREHQQIQLLRLHYERYGSLSSVRNLVTKNDEIATFSVAQTSQCANDDGVALPSTAAQCRRSDAATACLLELVQQRQRQAVAAHPDRVAESDRSAVDVHDVVGEAELTHLRVADGRERFVDLEQVDVGERQPGPLEGAADRPARRPGATTRCRARRPCRSRRPRRVA